MLKGFLESVDAEPLMQCLLHLGHSVKEKYDYFICAIIDMGWQFSKHNRKEGTKSGQRSPGKLSRAKRGEGGSCQNLRDIGFKQKEELVWKSRVIRNPGCYLNLDHLTLTWIPF